MTNLPDKNEVLTIFKGISEDLQTLVRQEGLLVLGGALVARARASAKGLDLVPTQSLQSLKKDLRVLAPGA